MHLGYSDSFSCIPLTLHAAVVLIWHGHFQIPHATSKTVVTKQLGARAW